MYQPREHRLLSEWLHEKYPSYPVRMCVPLGPAPKEIVDRVGEEKALSASRPWRPEVDAIVFLERKLLVVEAKIFRVMDGLSKLQVYDTLVPSTPELKDYAKWPREKILLVAWTAPWLEEAARVSNTKIEVYTPDWIKAYVEEIHKYWTKEYREARIAGRYGSNV